MKRPLPTDRTSLVHEFTLSGTHATIILGFYSEGDLGEIFLQVAKEGSTLAGLLDGWAIAVSTAIQYGASAEGLLQQFVHTKFEPAGWTERGQATSILDYVARYAIEHQNLIQS